MVASKVLHLFKDLNRRNGLKSSELVLKNIPTY